MSEYFHSARDHFDALPTWGKVIAGVVVTGGAVHLLKFVAKNTVFKQNRPFKNDYKPGVVYVYQFPRATVIPSFSPYALKLETWLRMADVKYENVDIPMWIRSKEGTLPFVELNGIEYDDSTFIIRDLTKILKKESVDASLSTEQKAISRAFEQMVDNSTFASFAYIRVTDHYGKLISKKYMGFDLPLFVRMMYPFWWIKRTGLQRLQAHGIGKHSVEEINGIGLDDLRSISAYLSTKQYLHGDIPTRVDAFLFGYLAQIIYVPLDSPHQKLLTTECRNLHRYCDRIKARYWPDWDEICKTRALNTWKK